MKTKSLGLKVVLLLSVITPSITVGHVDQCDGGWKTCRRTHRWHSRQRYCHLRERYCFVRQRYCHVPCVQVPCFRVTVCHCHQYKYIDWGNGICSFIAENCGNGTVSIDSYCGHPVDLTCDTCDNCLILPSFYEAPSYGDVTGSDVNPGLPDDTLPHISYRVEEDFEPTLLDTDYPKAEIDARFKIRFSAENNKLYAAMAFRFKVPKETDGTLFNTFSSGIEMVISDDTDYDYTEKVLNLGNGRVRRATLFSDRSYNVRLDDGWYHIMVTHH